MSAFLPFLLVRGKPTGSFLGSIPAENQAGESPINTVALRILWQILGFTKVLRAYALFEFTAPSGEEIAMSKSNIHAFKF